MSQPIRTIYRGSTEYLEVAVTADVTLASQPVSISFDRTTWHSAAWTGDPGLTRTARLLVGSSGCPVPAKSTPVFVRITDNPEAPVIYAGTLAVRT